MQERLFAARDLDDDEDLRPDVMAETRKPASAPPISAA
jgi:hypothetical protein